MHPDFFHILILSAVLFCLMTLSSIGLIIGIVLYLAAAWRESEQRKLLRSTIFILISTPVFIVSLNWFLQDKTKELVGYFHLVQNYYFCFVILILFFLVNTIVLQAIKKRRGAMLCCLMSAAITVVVTIPWLLSPYTYSSRSVNNNERKIAYALNFKMILARIEGKSEDEQINYHMKHQVYDKEPWCEAYEHANKEEALKIAKKIAKTENDCWHIIIVAALQDELGDIKGEEETLSQPNKNGSGCWDSTVQFLVGQKRLKELNEFYKDTDYPADAYKAMATSSLYVSNSSSDRAMFIARTLYRSGFYDDAEKYYQKVIANKKEAKISAAIESLADLYSSENMGDKLVALYFSYKSDPRGNDRYVFEDLGHKLFALERDDFAAEAYNKVFALDANCKLDRGCSFGLEKNLLLIQAKKLFDQKKYSETEDIYGIIESGSIHNMGNTRLTDIERLIKTKQVLGKKNEAAQVQNLYNDVKKNKDSLQIEIDKDKEKAKGAKYFEISQCMQSSRSYQ